MAKHPRPQGHHIITPACIVSDAAATIAFMEKAFDGKLTERYDMPDGKVAHAEVMIGDCVVMVGDAIEGMVPEMPAALSFYVDDAAAVDATYKRALDAGAKDARPPENQFYGYRSATVMDSTGNRWTICCDVEQLTSEQMHARMAEMAK